MYRGLEERQNIAALILIDFKKAFDYVDHHVAVADLISMGCRASIMPFVISFLTGRQHRVRYLDALSDYADITCGVPQGTKAGGVVFLALVNSLCMELEHRAKYVDDLSLAHIISILNDINFAPLQDNLNNLEDQCQKKNMEPNPVKSAAMYSMPPKRPITLPDLHLNGVPIPVVDECKLLGVHLNSGLNWKTHVDKMLKKANKTIFILIRAKKFQFSLPSLVMLYEWYIRTALEYAAPVWHPGLTEQQHEKLERIQRRSLQIILGREYGGWRERGGRYVRALQRLQMSSLRERREALTLRLGRQMLRSPDHRGLLPPLNVQRHGRNLRNNHLLQGVRCRTARYANTFIPYVVKLLNQNV